jgi:hypothetical protein
MIDYLDPRPGMVRGTCDRFGLVEQPARTLDVPRLDGQSAEERE